jgi:hypothetical protein
VETLNPRQRVEALELNDIRKAECVCTWKSDASELTVPEFQLTSAGYPQMRTHPAIVVDEENCKCESDFPWGPVFLGIGLGIGLAALFRSKKASAADIGVR